MNNDTERKYNTAINWLIEYRIDEFYKINGRFPNEIEELQMEMQLNEDDIRDALSFNEEV